MQTLLAFAIGGLFAAGLYMMLRRSLAKLIVGVAMLTNAANLLIFTVGGLTRARPPLVPAGEARPPAAVADPLPQAIILTAIVIGFGVLAFTMILSYRAFRVIATDDLDQMNTTDTIAAWQPPAETYAEERESAPEAEEPAPPTIGGEGRR